MAFAVLDSAFVLTAERGKDSKRTVVASTSNISSNPKSVILLELAIGLELGFEFELDPDGTEGEDDDDDNADDDK